MNEKSKAFELIEFVWNNEKTDSYLRVNIAMYEAVKLAIISQMKFNKEDFQNIFSKFSGGYLGIKQWMNNAISSSPTNIKYPI